jgi:diguanylate cyclase (GGDEF)-like protein
MFLAFPEAVQAAAPGPQAFAHWRSGLFALLGALALASWRLNQNRLTAVALGLAASAAWTASAGPAGGAPLRVPDLWLVAVPSGLALSLLPKEGALTGGRTLGRTALLFLPAGLAWAALASDPAECERWLRWTPWGPSSLGPSLLAHSSLALLVLPFALDRHARIESAAEALAGGALGCAALDWGLAVAAPDASLQARVWLAAHLAWALSLGIGLFLLYWQRVYLDELTGAPNRRALDEKLSHLERDFSLAMVDIDHFKKFNDTYGHDQGDDVLRMVAAHLIETTSGRAFRYGGEEFCVLAEDLDSEGLAALMDASRAALAAREFHIRLPSKARKAAGPKSRGRDGFATQRVQVTVSIGVARRDRRRTEPGQVLKLADEGLYEAKEGGRNAVIRKN